MRAKKSHPNVTAVLILLYLFFPFPLQSADKVKLGYVALSVPQSIVWIAKEAGFFQKYDLDVDLVLLPGGSLGASMLLAGEVSAVQAVSSELIYSRLQGGELVAVALVLSRLTFFIASGKNIRSSADLKGKKAAVSRYGTSTDDAMRLWLKSVGLEPERDVAILQLGTAPIRLAALEQGRVDAAILTADFGLKAQSLGYPILADLSKLNLEYPQTGLTTSRLFIARNRQIMLNLLKAYVEGIHYFLTNKRATLAVMQKYMKVTDSATASVMYDYFRGAIAQKPYPVAAAMGNLLDIVVKRTPEAAKFKPDQFIDASLIKELDQSGFIDRLYR